MYYTLGFWQLGGMEIVLILVVMLLLFGRRLPELGRSLGRGLVEFKKGVQGVKDELDSVDSQVKKELEDEKKPKSGDGDQDQKIEADSSR